MSWYTELLNRRPFATKCVTSALIAIGGDVVQQRIEYSFPSNRSPSSTSSLPPYRHDFYRTLRMAAWGGIYIGPVFHGWFGFLDRLIHLPSPSKSVALKLLIDQTVMAPITTASFFVCMGILEGGGIDEIRQKLSHSLPSTLLLNYYLWPAAQFVNFQLVPLKYRVLFLNATGFFWNIALSKKNAESRVQREGEGIEMAEKKK